MSHYSNRYLLLILLILSLPTFLHSRTQFKHITESDGLSDSQIECILRDHKGFMWFGAEIGLNRYDGYSVKVYKHDPDDSTSLSNNQIQAMLEDEQGKIWICTYGGGLNRFDPVTDTFTHFEHNPNDRNTISNNYLLSICEGKSGILWIGTNGTGIDKFDIKKGIFRNYSSNPQNPDSLNHGIVRSIYEDISGILWIGTSGGGLNRLDPETGIFSHYKNDPVDPHSLSDNSVACIVEDDPRFLWIAAGNLHLFDKARGIFTRYVHDPHDPTSIVINRPNFICKSSIDPNILWITTGGGLEKFYTTKNRFVHFKHESDDPNSLNTERTRTVFADRTGLLWIGTENGGVNIYNNKTEIIRHFIHHPDKLNSLSSNNISAVYEDRSGILWIGTGKGGLNRYDRSSNTFKRYIKSQKNPLSINDNDVNAILEGQPGVLWVGTYGGLNRFDTKNEQFTRFYYEPVIAASETNNSVFALCLDHEGDLLAGTIEAGLLIFNYHQDGKSVFHQFTHDPSDPTSISDNTVLAIYEDKTGNLWIGTMSGGLNKFDKKEKKFTCYEHNSDNPGSISSNCVNTIYQDESGVLWIGTFGGGLNKYDPLTESFIPYREKDGLANDVILGILEDKNNNLWISTRNGLSKFNPKAVDAQGKALPTAFKNYYTEDGLTSNSFSYCSYFKTNDGEMFFGTADGLNAFYPEKLEDNKNTPPIFITDFKVRNENYALDTAITEINTIVLSHEENFISFEFTALDYFNPHNNRYAYRMEGIDPDWVYTDASHRYAIYTEVSPGDYIFRVKGSNSDGLWNEKGTSISISILPPWWRTNWAYMIYLFLIVSAIFSIWHFQTNRLKLKHQLEIEHLQAEKLMEIDHMKSQFFTNISHEFRTPLTLILSPLEKMLLKTSDKEILNDLNIMQRNARRLHRLINQLLDLSKLEVGKMTLQVKLQDIVSLINRIVQTFESQAKIKNISLQFNAGEEEIQAYIDQEKIENIFYNLLSNAMKYTPAGGKVTADVSTIPTPSSPSTEILEKAKIPISPDKSPRPPGILSRLNTLGFNKFAVPNNIGRQHARLLTATGHQLEEIKLPADSEFVQITISDTGPGIAQNNIDKIFDRFYRAENHDVHEHEGSGIGLSLTKELVELHKGKIFLNSIVGKGTTFTVILPLGKGSYSENEIVTESEKPVDIVSAKMVPAPRKSQSQTTMEVGEKEKLNKTLPLLLIVEDNTDMRSHLKDSLCHSFSVIEGQTGKEGLKMAVKNVPELIISDVMMPGMDGFELCSRVKNNPRTSHIPVILLTARATMDDKIGGLEKGADEYLTKPFHAKELQLKVKNLIEQRHKLKERFIREISIKPTEITVTKMDEKFLRQAVEIVETKISDPEFDVNTFTREMGVSRTNLYLKLNALTGLSVKEFIRLIRLKRAAQLLRQNAGTISEIAYEVGFNNHSYFTECFQKQFKQSPSQFKSQHVE